MRTLGAHPSENGPTQVVLFSDIKEEMRYLRSLVSDYRERPQIRNLAVKIVQDAGNIARDKKAQALAIASWVQQNILYIHELPERFQTPDETLRLKAGDCDDFTTLIGAMLESVGIPSVLVVMCIDGLDSHIFPAAIMKDGAFLPLDATMTVSVHQIVNPISVTKAAGKKVMLKLA